MAAPTKDGINYFPLDVGFFRDKKIRLIKGEFGSKGLVILLFTLSHIYENEGYYMSWDSDDCILMADAIACGVTPDLISQVIKSCVKRHIFDEELFNVAGILTSSGIQRRYLRAKKESEEIRIIKEYFLLDTSSKKDVTAGILNKIVFFSKETQIYPVNLQINSINPQINEQNKINKNKLNNNTLTPGDKTPDKERINYKKITDFWNDTCIGLSKVRGLSDTRKRTIKRRIEEYGEEQVMDVIKQVMASDFLTGKNSNKWQATFDWVMKPSNFLKILEGNYDNKTDDRAVTTDYYAGGTSI